MTFHLAQLNIARLLHPLDAPEIKDFVDGLDSINRLAELSPGFVWRLKSGSGNATDIRHPWSQDPFVLVNLSVWETPGALKEFVYRSGHLEYYLRRIGWFEKPSEANYVLWWTPKGQIPTLEEARDRLEHYRRYGSTPYAFWFGKLMPAPRVVVSPVVG
jgi:hypothetical protein